MYKLNLIAIVAIVAVATLVAGFAAPVFAQGNTSSPGNMTMNMTGGNTTGMTMPGNMTMNMANSSSSK
jgi:hypothetical protein